MKTYNVEYPSGMRFSLDGEFQLAPLGDLMVPVVFQGESDAKILDQRAVVSDGVEVVYTPRQNMDGLDPEMSKWLKLNPEWGRP